jgi:antitoxin ParD1/3/4
MHVNLSGEVEQFVREEVASGRYHSAQEVVQEGLRLLHERTILDEQRRGRLNEQIEQGLAELDRGEGIPGEKALRSLWEKSRQRRAAQ